MTIQSVIRSTFLGDVPRSSFSEGNCLCLCPCCCSYRCWFLPLFLAVILTLSEVEGEGPPHFVVALAVACFLQSQPADSDQTVSRVSGIGCLPSVSNTFSSLASSAATTTWPDLSIRCGSQLRAAITLPINSGLSLFET